MKTVEITLYKFEELSKEAKSKAIDHHRCTEDNSHIYDEAYETVKKFHEIFGTSEGSRSWLDINTNFETDITELAGLRLRTYLINNFGYALFTPKYKSHFGDNKVIKHPRVKTNFYDMSKGARVNSSNMYYSAIQKDNCCVLTGVCYDDSLLQPIYDFIEYKLTPEANKHEDIVSLFEECFASLEKDIENEVEAQNSEEYITEYLEDQEQDFTEEGSIY